MHAFATAIVVALLTLPAAAANTDSTSLTITGAVERPMTLRLLDLQARPIEPATVEMQGPGGAWAPVYFIGVQLWDLLHEAGLKPDRESRNERLAHVVLVTGADGYKIAFSIGELDPALGNARAMLAIAGEKGALGTTEGGMARLILQGDHRQLRSIGNVVKIEVR
jgi:DMSO/TMAO reductase YedYZ molybdopterin-dependent catalytic subunit